MKDRTWIMALGILNGWILGVIFPPEWGIPFTLGSVGLLLLLHLTLPQPAQLQHPTPSPLHNPTTHAHKCCSPSTSAQEHRQDTKVDSVHDPMGEASTVAGFGRLQVLPRVVTRGNGEHGLPSRVTLWGESINALTVDGYPLHK
jgi:hypothetical protein